MLKKVEKDGYYKDTKTGALLNKNTNGIKQYKKQKEKMRELDAALEDIDSLKSDVAILKKELASIRKAHRANRTDKQ